MQGSKTFYRGLFLVSVLSMLAGCAAGAKHRGAPAGEPDAALPAAVPAVKRLGDGREGFVISETPRMDGESRRAFERASALMENRDYDQAIELLEKVIAHPPGVTAPYINLAIAYRQTDRPEKAEQHLKAALELFPGHPLASNEYGLLLRQGGRFAEARAIYEQALAAFPDYHPVRRNLGILCDLYLDDKGCALQHYEIYSQARPSDAQVQIWIADLRARLEP